MGPSGGPRAQIWTLAQIGQFDTIKTAENVWLMLLLYCYTWSKFAIKILVSDIGGIETK